ncbi:MAG: hypothetical protein KAV00_13290 [Phycisphaerae bacterium]|nr:hypothetical protein [Phycisphaerae bacterium]
MGLFRRHIKNFQLDEKEIFFRSWWLANKCCTRVAEIYGPMSASMWIDDERYLEQDKKVFFEILGYAMCHVLGRIRDEIELYHGWTDDTYDLNMSYQVLLSTSFAKVLGAHEEDGSIFKELLMQYCYRDFNDDYDDYNDYWGISHEVTDEEMNKTLGEFIKDALNDPKVEEDYNYEKVFVYRMSKIVDVVDRDKVIDNAQNLYRDIGLTYYDKAFFGLSCRKIKKELQEMVNH